MEMEIKDLIGKQVVKVRKVEVDVYKNGENVVEVYHLYFSDGTKMMLSGTGNCTAQFGQVLCFDEKEYKEWFKDI